MSNSRKRGSNRTTKRINHKHRIQQATRTHTPQRTASRQQNDSDSYKPAAMQIFIRIIAGIISGAILLVVGALFAYTFPITHKETQRINQVRRYEQIDSVLKTMTPLTIDMRDALRNHYSDITSPRKQDIYSPMLGYHTVSVPDKCDWKTLEELINKYLETAKYTVETCPDSKLKQQLAQYDLILDDLLTLKVQILMANLDNAMIWDPSLIGPKFFKYKEESLYVTDYEKAKIIDAVQASEDLISCLNSYMKQIY